MKKIVKKLMLFVLAAALVITGAVPSFAATADKYGEKKALTSEETGKVTMNNGCKHTYIEASNGCRYFVYCYSCMDGLTRTTPTNHQSTVTIDGVKYTLGNYSIGSNGASTKYANVIRKASDTTSTIAVTAVKLSASSATLTVGKTKTLTATVSPSNATSSEVSWSSSNSSVASVNIYGKVTAKAAGTATITATSNNGKTATCKVTVKSASVAVTSVSLSASTATLTVGGTKTLTATVKPSNATSKTVTWSSSNTSVATVTGSGKITAKKAGTAAITAKTSNGKTATCKVTVKSASVAVTSVSLSASTATLTVGGTKTLTATVKPSNATSKTVTWSSSNTSVATVTGSGKITAKKAGTATITAKTSNGKKATCKVTVKSASGTYLDVSSAYTQLNTFRTTSGVWYWNSNNKTKTYFNKSGYTTLSKLTKSSALEAVAKQRAKELATSYSHTRPDGSSCFTLYTSCTDAAENIAMGQTSVTAVMTSWKEENESYSGQGHRRNMLSTTYNAVGIACYKVDGVCYWVMALGKI